MAGADPRFSQHRYPELRLWVLDRDRWLCQIKGPHCAKFATQVDHIVARADGGDFWNPANLRAACRPCNSRGGAERTNNRFRYRNEVADYVTRF